jgi:hypothetical protein
MKPAIHFEAAMKHFATQRARRRRACSNAAAGARDARPPVRAKAGGLR